MKTLSYLSWVVLFLGLAAWAGVAYFNYWIQAEATSLGKNAVTAEHAATDAAYQQRVKSLAVDTAADRARLEELIRIDIVSTADRVERAGDEVGIDARVGAALPAGTPTELPDGGSLQAIAFVVQAEGSFSGLVRFVKVLEKFPGASSVEQFEFQKAGDAGSTSPWRATVRLRLLTTADTSS